ncbi:chromatin structure-remodeling complex protein RSC7 [Entomortierella parvispora]|uniref:Chromatin structure-remodeling complex protein RSC7 n=1 Tax=Entomortierella parvispora TaxID=205924 RepID=A0A9P3LZ94_9FUNG|nr:chromatin structure-remodeling complex protein RSC7 [Entomortierella parvispora]
MAPSAPGSSSRRNASRGSSRNNFRREGSYKNDARSKQDSDSEDPQSDSPARSKRPTRRAASRSKPVQPALESEDDSNSAMGEEDDASSRTGGSVQEEVEGTVDESGEAKITKEGELLGGREYKCRTFKLPDRDDTIYMLSMDPARVLGFRDSYIFFLKNPRLSRIITTLDERQWMIDNGILMSNLKTKGIAVVTARSVFKLFGSKIIKNGRARLDDYFESPASMEEADDSDAASRTGDDNARGGSTGGHTEEGTPAASSSKRKHTLFQEESTRQITDLNWQYESAMAVRNLNSQLKNLRKEHSKFLDPHTNIEQVPLMLQPTRCEVRGVTKRPKLGDSENPPTAVVSIPSSIGPTTDASVRVEIKGAVPPPPFIDDPSVWAVIPEDIQRSLEKAEMVRSMLGQEGNEDQTKYPISILSGQFQASYPIHQSRFKQPYRVIVPQNMAAHAQYIHHLWTQQPRQEVPLLERVSGVPGPSSQQPRTGHPQQPLIQYQQGTPQPPAFQPQHTFNQSNRRR